jgi:pimeloyl-ACP methyl ester carboxylesterase
MADHTVSMVDVGGTGVRVMRGGAGPPLLQLHGAGGGDAWLPFMHHLAQHFEVIAPEHPGFGGGEPPPWLETVSDLANFYLDFIERLGLDRVHLVGQSLGGWIAADLAVRNASRLASLALVDAAGIYLAGVPQLDPFVVSEEQAIRDFFYDQTIADEVLARVVRPETEDVRLANQRIVAKLTWQPRLHDPHLAKWLHRIRVPTLVAWGENDRLFPPAYAYEWQRLIPGSKLVLVARCGHAPAAEKPAELAAAIHAFCSKEAVAA